MGLLSCFRKVTNRPFNKNKKSDHEIKSFSDLPDDIFRFIMEHLCYSDQIRCRAVCKSWKSNICGVKYSDKLPWVFTYRKHLFYLYDPYHRRKHTIESKKKIPEGSVVIASNFGWLLFSEPYYYSRHCSLFLYNPFTDEIINLPSLPFRSVHLDQKLLCSESPTSPNCVIFAVWFDHLESFCIIKTCCPRDTTWAVHSFYCFDYGYILGIAYFNGVLYCAFSEGTLCTFNFPDKEWKIYPQEDPQSYYIGYNLMIDSEGNLFLIDVYEWHIFCFDWSQMKWICSTKSLTNKMLFFDDKHKQCNLLLSVGEESPELVNTMHLCRWLLSVYFFRSSTSRRLPPQPYADYWRKYLGSRKFSNIWIQPPQIR